MTTNDDNFPMLTPHALGFEPKKKTEESELEEEIKEEPETIPEDRFPIEIEKIKKTSSPVIREAIERASCFGSGFYMDPSEVIDDEEDDEGGVCLQMDCDLRNLCHLVFVRSTKTDPLEFDEVEEPPLEFVPQIVKRKGGWKGTKKQVPRTVLTQPYVNLGRNVDKLADMIWKIVCSPPIIDSRWNYPPADTLPRLEKAKQKFVGMYGNGMVVCKRFQYHQYYLDGAHFMRYWLRTSGGGWLDMCPELCKIVEKHREMPLKESYRNKDGFLSKDFKFYPYRVWIAFPHHVKRLRHALWDLGLVCGDWEE